MFRRFINQKRILVRSMSNIHETPITPITIPPTQTPKIMYEADYMRLAKAIDENYSNHSNHKDRLNNHICYFIAGGVWLVLLTLETHQLREDVNSINIQLNDTLKYKADKHIVDEMATNLQQLKETHDKIAETFRC